MTNHFTLCPSCNDKKTSKMGFVDSICRMCSGVGTIKDKNYLVTAEGKANGEIIKQTTVCPSCNGKKTSKMGFVDSICRMCSGVGTIKDKNYLATAEGKANGEIIKQTTVEESNKSGTRSEGEEKERTRRGRPAKIRD